MVSDLHLGDKAPVARSAEVDWEAAQIIPLKQLAKYQQRYGCPVLIAGDLFDRYNPAPWVVNMALKHLPEQCYAVPGQHDMKHHNYSDIRKSVYWTLVESRKIVNLEPGRPVEAQSNGRILRLHGFPFGTALRALTQPHDLAIEVAVAHSYIWAAEGTGYKDAPEVSRLSKRFASMKGFDVCVFGDNHIPFVVDHNPAICNCGAFQRRKSDERKYDVMIGLLLANGKIKRKRLEASQEKWVDNADDAEKLLGGSSVEFVRELESLGDSALDFAAAVHRRLVGKNEEVKEVVLRCLDGSIVR